MLSAPDFAVSGLAVPKTRISVGEKMGLIPKIREGFWGS